jgi:hypothetical protein
MKRKSEAKCTSLHLTSSYFIRLHRRNSMPEITAKLSTALADRYQIERHLGEGGTATVYRSASGALQFQSELL